MLDQELTQLLKVTEEDLQNSVVDEYGCRYSVDYTRLLEGNSIPYVKVSPLCKMICRSAFLGSSLLESIVIPPTVKYIGNDAFSDCSALQQIILPNSLESLGRGAFEGCISIH